MPEKITGKTEDRAKLNFEQLLEFVAEKFPSCVIEKQTEEKNEDTGATEIRYERAINWQALGKLVGTELSEEQGSARRELFGFVWSGKNEAAREANRVIDMTLRPCPEESLDWDNTGNLYIEGDNLQALKMLQGSYLGKVKMIYIDPPYNTGKEFVYNDDFRQNQEDYDQEAGEIDEDSGARLVSKAFTINADTSPRYHSKWCSMMYSRLLLARDLLRRDGVIFISIDDHEQHHLRDICDEIFGECNFICNFVWRCSTAGGIRPKFVSKTHEYVLCYARNQVLLDMFYAPISASARKEYRLQDSIGTYREKDFVFQNPSKNENQRYWISCPDGELVRPKDGYIYRYIKKTFDEALKANTIVFKRSERGPLVTKEGMQAHWNIYTKKYLGDGTGAPSSLLGIEDSDNLVGTYNRGVKDLEYLFGKLRIFNNSKPVDLIKFFMRMVGVSDNDVVLDFFSGSATTAEAVMRANAEDGGNRRFILVQLPEECKENTPASQAGYRNICEIGKERIRRVAKAIASQTDCTKIVHGGGYEGFR